MPLKKETKPLKCLTLFTTHIGTFQEIFPNLRQISSVDFFGYCFNHAYNSLLNSNSEFKPVKLHLKIDLVSYPTRAEGLVTMITLFWRFCALRGFLA